MKVTSFLTPIRKSMKTEIKSQLRDLGYKGETDLDSILDALPMGIDRDDKRYDFIIEQKMFFSYSYYDKNELEEFYITRKENESLADTAARLLIQLYNAGLVKFKEE